MIIGKKFYSIIIVMQYEGVVFLEYNQLDAQFFEFVEYHSTHFGRSFHPSSGVQDCTYSIRYMSYRFVDCLLVGMRSCAR